MPRAKVKKPDPPVNMPPRPAFSINHERAGISSSREGREGLVEAKDGPFFLGYEEAAVGEVGADVRVNLVGNAACHPRSLEEPKGRESFFFFGRISLGCIISSRGNCRCSQFTIDGRPDRRIVRGSGSWRSTFSSDRYPPVRGR